MTTKKEAADPFQCPNGDPHNWEYRGKRAQTYRCLRCRIEITKAALKEATD